MTNQETNQIDLQCPICMSKDFCVYVFVEHNDEGDRETLNPSDNHFIFVCERLHVFDSDGLILKGNSQK